MSLIPSCSKSNALNAIIPNGNGLVNSENASTPLVITSIEEDEATAGAKSSDLVGVRRIVRAMSPIDDLVTVARDANAKKKLFFCSTCNKTFPNAKRLSAHAKTFHELKKEETCLKCGQCNKEFLSIHAYNLHLRVHSDDNPFKCRECGLNLSSKTSLQKHFARFHDPNEDARKFVCDFEECGKSFINESELKMHKIRHTNEKNFMCELCGKRFAVKANLVGHLRIHRGEKPFSCDVCGQRFTHPNSLVGHRRIHTGERPYICNFCGKGYRVKHQLSSHLIVHSHDRPFKCEVCPKTFRSRSNLRVHKDEHQGIKRFSCSYCDRKFLVRGNMLKHVRRHIGERPHRCDLCGKSFIEKQELKNHMKTHQIPTAVRKTRKSKETKVQSSTNSSVLLTINEQDPVQITLQNNPIPNLLPIVGVQYFTNQQSLELPNDEQALPEADHQNVVFQEVVLENLTFTNFLRSQQFEIEASQLMQVKDDIFQHISENKQENLLQQAHFSQSSTRSQQGCKLCKQHFVNIRQHLIEYHRIVLSDFESHEHLVF